MLLPAVMSDISSESSHDSKRSRSPPLHRTRTMRSGEDVGKALNAEFDRSITREPDQDAEEGSFSGRGAKYTRSPTPVSLDATTSPAVEGKAVETIPGREEGEGGVVACLQRQLLEEQHRRVAAEERVVSLLKELDTVRTREDNKARMADISGQNHELSFRVSLLQREVEELKGLLHEKEKDIAGKEARIQLLQEKLVDQLLLKPSSSKAPKKTRSIAADSPVVSSRTDTSRKPVGNGERGRSPIPKKPGMASPRRCATAPLSLSVASDRSVPSRNRVSGGNHISQSLSSSKPLGSPGAVVTGARRLPTGPSLSSVSLASLSQSRQTYASETPRKRRTIQPHAIITAPTRKTPSRAHPGGLKKEDVKRNSPLTVGPASTGPPPRASSSTRAGSSMAKPSPSRLSVTPLHTTTPTRTAARSVLSGDTRASRLRPHISCSVGRNDEMVLKSTSTTVTFKSRSLVAPLAGSPEDDADPLSGAEGNGAVSLDDANTVGQTVVNEGEQVVD